MTTDCLPSSSSSKSALCAVCNHHFSIYTCPRCMIKTCSLQCSSSHKTTHNCSGERNRAAYVPMNRYTWGTMMNDYSFLEDVGRLSKERGHDIVKNGLDKGIVKPGSGHLAKRRRGPEIGRSKRDLLKNHLEALDMDVDFFPVGMERRIHNQSVLDHKRKVPLLTIEFRFHPPSSTMPPASERRPFVMLTHRNDMQSPISTLARSCLEDRKRSKSKKDEPIPQWVVELVCPEEENSEYPSPHFVMAAPSLHQPSASAPKYYRLDSTKPFSSALRGTYFVEYPTIDIWDEFQGITVDLDGVVRVPSPPPKRRKLTQKQGKAAIQGLLGDYGSSDEEETGPNEFTSLQSYDSDSEEAGRDSAAEDEEDNTIPSLEPEALLALLRQAQANVGEDDDDDELDWGDSETGD